MLFIDKIVSEEFLDLSFGLLMIGPYTFLHPLLVTRPLLLNIDRTQPLPSIFSRQSILFYITRLS